MTFEFCPIADEDQVEIRMPVERGFCRAHDDAGAEVAAHCVDRDDRVCRHSRQVCPPADSPALAGRTGMIDRFERVVTVDGDELTDEDRRKLLIIADKCPVHRTLEAASSISTRLAD